jgi:hypothetical protein
VATKTVAATFYLAVDAPLKSLLRVQLFMGGLNSYRLRAGVRASSGPKKILKLRSGN